MRHPSSSDVPMINKLNDYKWQLLALGLLVGGMMLSRGGAAALVPLAKFIVPVVTFVVLFKLLKKRVMGTIGESLKKKMEEMMQMQQGAHPGGPGPRPAGKGGKVLDMCPKCGAMLAPGHRCK